MAETGASAAAGTAAAATRGVPKAVTGEAKADRSPMEIKSALMTTATTKDNEGKPIQRQDGSAATPLDYGAGHVVPNSADDPGLVYESTPADWAAYPCAIGQLPQTTDGSDPCADVRKFDPSDLNSPTISVGDIAGKQTVTRTVTDVTGTDGVYRATLRTPPGYRVWNLKAISTLIRARVHRWSSQPCSAGPSANSFSNSANWPSDSLGSFGGPAEARASIPPSRQARRQLTRRSFAITAVFSPRANRPPASYRIRSRNRRRSAVSPPPCAYRIPPAYRRDQHTSPPNNTPKSSVVRDFGSGQQGI
ncbi:hypothetical protein [Streptomyces sp. SA15]|uniref:hypothetical protein n=1 Tax=Streptomyces sp. SA15 TaxID=934019 RepID=UPI00211B85D4|nr:hypothetical protein [Streptomyces sp. SA15]